MLNKKYRPDIRNFKIIDEKTVLIGDFECQISKLHAFSDGLDYHPYVYIEVNSLESLNSEKTNKSASFDDEEYVVYDNRIVSIGEREAGVIENSDGTTIKVEQKDFETRIRPLKKTNWIILSPTHPANNSTYETQITRLMEDILSGEKTLKDLDSFVARLPKPDFYEF